MNRYLADALRDPPEEWVPAMFYESFQTAQSWLDYFDAYFPDGVRSVLDTPRGWRPAHFQALYIASWTYKPVVKGSYMLRLTDDQVENVRHAYSKKLSGRWTSHLHGPTTKGADASKGWRFLRGYHELLIQVEEARDGTYLFLKCEGHPAVSYAHIKSWQHKRKHGVGRDVNEDMLMLASRDDLHLGIKVRAAENYSPAYKELMHALGLKKVLKKQGEIIDTRDAAELLLGEMHDAARSDVGLRAWLDQQLLPLGVSLENPLVGHSTQTVKNNKLSRVFDVIARFPDRALQRLGGAFWDWPVLVAMRNARTELASISTELMNDHLRLNKTTTRYFQEVVIVPEDIDYGLDKARRLLAMAKGT